MYCAPKASALTSRYPTQPTASASSATARETAIQAPGSPHNARDRSDVESAFGGGGVQQKGVGELASSAPKALALTSRYPTQPTASASSAPARETAIQAPGSPRNARDRTEVDVVHLAVPAFKKRKGRGGELTSSSPKAWALASRYPTQPTASGTKLSN